MKNLRLISFTMALSAGWLCADHILFLAGRTTTVRTSNDEGATWTVFMTDTNSGAQLRGLAVDGANGVVFVNDINAGSAAARPLYAYNAAGAPLDTTTFDESGVFNQRPIAFWNSFVYQNAGAAGGAAGQCTGLSGFNANVFDNKPLANANSGNWQGNDMRLYVADDAAVYCFMNGTSGANLRRYTVDAGGTFSGTQTITLDGPTVNNTDFAFSALGRLLVLDAASIWVSASNNLASTGIALTPALTFGGTENAGAGDLGPNGRDMVLLGNTLYAVTDQNCYKFTLDDEAGTLSFVSAAAHGFNNTGVQIDGVIPEPAVLLPLLLVLGCLESRQRRD